MELENLKTIWKNTREFPSKDETEIASMLHAASKSIVNKLKRNVWLEMIFMLVTSLALLVYAMMLEDGSLKWTSISIQVLFLAYSFYYTKKLLLLSRFDPGKGNVKANLEILLADLTGYLKFYKRSYAFFYPVYFFLVLLFGLLERGTDEFVRILNKPEIILYLVGAAIVFFICSVWFTNWYLKKLYGNHLQKLKDLLMDLQSMQVSAGEPS